MSTLRMHKTGSGSDAPARSKQSGESSSLWTGRSRLITVVLAVAAAGALAATAATLSSSGAKTATIPAGTRLIGALDRTISTERTDAGASVQLETTTPLRLSEDVIIPAGITIHGEVTHSEGGGRISGSPELTLRFSRLTVDGRDYRIATDPWRVKGKSDTKESIAEIAGGAVVGGVIGAVAGSATKGAVIGGILGTGVAVATKGNQIVLPAGQRLRIRLAEPVTVRYTPQSG
jgi:hypothetical protein